MHNAGELAALIAAVFFAAGACAAIYVLARLARLIAAGTRLLADVRSRSDTVFEQAQAAVDRAHRQLGATGSVITEMDELNAGVSQLSEQVTALAGLGRAIASGPAGRVGAFVYGVRHAVALRRDGTARPDPAVPPAAPVQSAAVQSAPVPSLPLLAAGGAPRRRPLAGSGGPR